MQALSNALMEVPASSGTGLTVAEALSLPVLRAGLPEVLAGAEHLDRCIRWVHAAEVPNIAELLVGGELLLTTGMGMSANVGELRRFASQLAERGVAAVVIELGTTLRSVHPAFLQEADEQGLPVITLHRRVKFLAVAESILPVLVSSRYDVLRRGHEVGRHLTQLMLEGAGVVEVLQAIATVLGNPVALESGERFLLSSASPPGAPCDVAELWRDLRHVGDGFALPTIGAPVPMGANRHGQLWLLGTERDPDEVADIVVHHAAGLLAVSLASQSQQEDLRTQELGDLLDDLAHGRLGSADALSRTTILGAPVLPSEVVPFAVAVPRVVGAAERAWADALADATTRLRANGVAAIAGRSRELSVVLGVAAGTGERASTAETIAASLRGSLASHFEAPDSQVAVGRITDWAGCGGELWLSARAAAAASPLAPARWHPVEDLEVEGLLWHLRTDPEIGAFVDRAIGVLLERDKRRKLKLVSTLESFVVHGGNKTATARDLRINRQGLYDRLRRIERELGVDLGDPRQRLRLHLAVRAHRLHTQERSPATARV